MLPEDRLQMKWRESEGSSLGYLVQVKPRAGRGPPSPLCGPTANTARRSLCWLPSALPSLLAVSPLAQGGCGGRTGPLMSTACPHTWHVQKAVNDFAETRTLPQLRALRTLTVPSPSGRLAPF